MQRSFISLLMFFTYFTVNAQSFQRTDKGVIIYPEKAPFKAIQIQPISKTIIHVITSPVKEVKMDTSLMLVSQANFTNWSLSKKSGSYLVSTTALKMIISGRTGNIRFYNSTGDLLLSSLENETSFDPTLIESGSAYSIRQGFSSSEGESFFGLGQHQQGVINYKGESVELVQNNTEVAIPFMVSSKNYGLLWDNYSITCFNDGRGYLPLNQLQLFDKNGVEGSITATYYKSKVGNDVFTSRNESIISYDYLSSLQQFPPGFSLGEGKVTWEGFVRPSLTGLYKLAIRYGGYTRLFIDNNLVLDRWRQCWNPATAIVPYTFDANRKYRFRLEWIPDGGESFISCNWMPPASAIDKKRFILSSEAAYNINYYFIYGNDKDDLIAGYRKLTGKAPIVPKWALGLWQSRERYKSQSDIISTVKEFRKRNVPLDNIVMDWQYWKPDEWGSQQFDPVRFPDPKGMIDSLHNLYHTHFMISVWPKFYQGIPNYDRFNKKGWLLTRNIDDSRKDWLGYVSTFYDAFNPSAGKEFWRLLNDNLYSKGVDAWWMDAPEPDIHSNLSLEQRKRLMYPNAIGSAIKYFNAYPLVNAAPIYLGQRSRDPNKRVFILTRSAYAGSQRYAASVWSGDIAARWHDMKNQVAAGVNFSMSGLPYWTMDIGGFAVEHRFENAKGEDAKEWKEQMTRWYQFGAFTPLFRVHGQFPFREIYNVSTESDSAYQSMLYYDKLRYRLLPYLYSLAGKTYLDDYTPMRGLFMDFSNDKASSVINDQYLLGPSLLIAPICEYGQREREVYLPKGVGWYNLYTGKYYAGGQEIKAPADYTRMPVFIKEGSILPFGNDLQYTSEKPADTLQLFIYTGKDASFQLYEDDGNTYNYEQGKYSVIPINYNERSQTLIIDNRLGNFPGMIEKRVFKVKWVRKDKSTPLLFDRADTMLYYDGSRITTQIK